MSSSDRRQVLVSKFLFCPRWSSFIHSCRLPAIPLPQPPSLLFLLAPRSAPVLRPLRPRSLAVVPHFTATDISASTACYHDHQRPYLAST